MKILIIGTNNILGQVTSLFYYNLNHHITGLDSKKSFFSPTNSFFEISISKSNLSIIRDIIINGNYDAIINCAALLIRDSENNPDDAEFINSMFPHFLEDITKNLNTIVVHRSTDCIFSGKKGKYTINDIPDDESIYSKTKAMGELVNKKDITIRTSLIGPDINTNGIDLFNWFNNQRGNVNGYANSIWTGITTIEYAKTALTLLTQKAHGLFQCVPNESISKYDLLLLFQKYFPRVRNIIKLENDKIDKSLVQYFGNYKLAIPSYEIQLKEMKEWIQIQNIKTQNIYSHYTMEENYK